MKDKKGKLIGLSYDYEYRGRKRERFRDMPLWKSYILLGMFAFLFALPGFLILFDKSAEAFTAYACFGMAGLFVFLIYNQYRKHKMLMDMIKSYRKNNLT